MMSRRRWVLLGSVVGALVGAALFGALSTRPRPVEMPPPPPPPPPPPMHQRPASQPAGALGAHDVAVVGQAHVTDERLVRFYLRPVRVNRRLGLGEALDVIVERELYGAAARDRGVYREVEARGWGRGDEDRELLLLYAGLEYRRRFGRQEPTPVSAAQIDDWIARNPGFVLTPEQVEVYYAYLRGGPAPLPSPIGERAARGGLPRLPRRGGPPQMVPSGWVSQTELAELLDRAAAAAVFRMGPGEQATVRLGGSRDPREVLVRLAGRRPAVRPTREQLRQEAIEKLQLPARLRDLLPELRRRYRVIFNWPLIKELKRQYDPPAAAAGGRR